ncbi:MAG: hypothetical protein V1913_00890 [Fibrobacterota bacterium]
MGSPIKVYAVFSSPVDEATIEWHTKGRIVEQASQKYGTRAITTDTLSVDWNNINSVYYDLNNHDTLYMTFQNNNEISNKEIIYLVNHAPDYDTIKMNSIPIARKQDADSLNIIRMHMNPTIKCSLKVWTRDIDLGDKPKFFIEGLPLTVHANPDSAMDSLWVFNGWSSDTFFQGFLRIEDGRGGISRYPFEVVVYSEVHSLWVASTYGPNGVSMVSKLTAAGRKLFSLIRFQQVKFLSVLASDRSTGTEATWIVDRTLRSYVAGTGKNYSDTVFITDDDGRVVRSIGGFGSNLTGLSLNMTYNVAYVIDSNAVKKVTFTGQVSQSYAAADGRIEAVGCYQYNLDDFWAAVSTVSGGIVRKFVVHVVSGVVHDTLRRNGFAAWDSLASVKSISVDTRNNILWIGDDARILVADARTDTLLAIIDSCKTPYIFADQEEPYCWVADSRSSRLLRLSFWVGTTPLPAYTTVTGAATGGYCTVLSGNGLALTQPRSLAIDYNIDSRHLQKVVWVADYNNNRILALDAASGAQIMILSVDLPLENPEAISVNVGTW